MTFLPFSRLFSMPAFEGLRILRSYLARRPTDSIDNLLTVIRRVESNARSFDMEAAAFLHEIVDKNAPFKGVAFYRVCLARVLLLELPEWINLVTLGRGRFIKRLKSPEYRDVRSLFRQARLLDEPPDADDIVWWDQLQSHVRSRQSQEAMKRARVAEQLTLKYEVGRLQQFGITISPRWISIEDNTVGYDILSYSPGEFGPINRLIEVKSTIASPLRFNVSRNEWEQARIMGEAFVFHIWDLKSSPPRLHELTVAQVAPHIPEDNEDGKWVNALIPVTL